MRLSNEQLHNLARHGAARHLETLLAEQAAIRKTFPGIGAGRPAGSRAGKRAPGKRAPGKRGWTPAQRRAAAARMKKYWATRKAKKSG